MGGSVGGQGLQHGLGDSAPVVLVVAQRGQHPRRVHVLDVRVVAVRLPVDVRQLACGEREMAM